MSQKDRRRWRWSIGLGAGLLLGNWAYGAEPLPAPQPGPAMHAAAPVTLFTLDDCLHYAYEHQPSLAAARASLAAAETQAKGLHELHAAPFLPGGRELPIRREQASIGVCIAQAALVQAEYDAAYAVRRTYLAVQYAQAQFTLSKKLIGELDAFNGIAQKLLPDTEAKVTERSSAGLIVIDYQLARSRFEEAQFGVERAGAALREAIGAGPECCFQVSDEGRFGIPLKGPAPWDQPELCKGDIISLALARRGEAEQTANLASVYRLEIDAQDKTCLLPTAHTFAAGSDIHARQVPPAFDDGVTIYRPGALAPEMPVLLVGPKCERQERATSLSARADAVADKTRNLIALEAEEAYWRWKESRARARDTYEAARAGLVLETINLKDTPQEMVKNHVRAAQAQAGFNEALYQYLISLAVLERVTAGGISSGLGTLPSNCQPLSAPAP